MFAFVEVGNYKNGDASLAGLCGRSWDSIKELSLSKNNQYPGNVLVTEEGWLNLSQAEWPTL